MLNKGAFALMAAKGINSVKDLKGKRIAVSSVGDAPYNYTVALLGKFGLNAKDVQWVPSGTDANSRALFLTTGRADATLLTAPAYFKVEGTGIQEPGESRRLQRHLRVERLPVHKENAHSKSKTAGTDHQSAGGSHQALLRRQALCGEGVPCVMMDDKQEPAEIERVYDLYAKTNAFERVPYVLAGAVKSVVDQADSQTATAMKASTSKPSSTTAPSIAS